MCVSESFSLYTSFPPGTCYANSALSPTGFYILNSVRLWVSAWAPSSCAHDSNIAMKQKTDADPVWFLSFKVQCFLLFIVRCLKQINTYILFSYLVVYLRKASVVLVTASGLRAEVWPFLGFESKLEVMPTHPYAAFVQHRNNWLFFKALSHKSAHYGDKWCVHLWGLRCV